MARYTGPVCRQCRREKVKLYLKGEKCDKACPMDGKKPYPPGEHGKDRQRQGSEYSTQLREKQKARRIYGILEKQFANTYNEANHAAGITGDNLLRMLELRLDSVTFRAGWASSRSQARQLVSHGHVTVNGKRVDIPSYRLKKGDTVALIAKTRENIQVRTTRDTMARRLPAWLEAEGTGFEVKVLNPPLREQIDTQIREQLIVELYSK